MALAVSGQRAFGTRPEPILAARSFHYKAMRNAGRWQSQRDRSTSTAVGALVSWSVDADGHVFPASGGTADEQLAHVVIDRHGVEWSVREVPTPQVWAKEQRCLVLNSRECVRRVWQYPRHWRTLDADALLRLGVTD